MRFILVGDKETIVDIRTPKNKKLGDILKSHCEHISGCEINGKFDDNWQDYMVCKKDKIRIFCKVGYGSESFFVGLILSIISSVISILLAPSPNKPSSSKNQPALGIAGIQNTLAPGTPKFLPYGTRRVFGHLIASKTSIGQNILGRTDLGRTMSFSALYFMGAGPLFDIKEVQIDGTGIENIQDGEPQAIIRLGTEDQEIIPGHEFAHQTYRVNMPMDARTSEDQTREPRSVTYTTRSDNISKVIITFEFPQGQWTNNTGTLNGQSYRVRFLTKIHGSCDWTDLGLFSTPRRKVTNGFFWEIPIELPSAGKWDISMTVESQDSYRATTAPFNLFNIQETQYVTTTYPKSALLEIHGIASDQITGFDRMQASALVCGRYVEVYRDGIYVKEFSRNRVWIVRDLLFNSEVALGNRLSASLWNNSAGADAAAYYEELVTGFDGDEQRDYCDIIINEIRSGADWIRALLFEGQAALINSSGRFTYIVDKDKLPNVLYSSPGNIVENTLQYQKGNTEKPINRIRAEYPDQEQEYKVIPAIYPAEIDGPEKSETISFTSITRESQASRLMQFRFNYLTLITDRWSWQSPDNAVVSEPYDVERLTYQVPRGLRGYAGLLPNNSSSTTKLYTGKQLYIAAGLSHTAVVRHLGTVEERSITNTPGQTYSILNLGSALSFTPELGDIWSAGVQEEHAREVQIDEIESDDGKFVIKAHKHIPALYDFQLIRVTDLVNVEEGDSFPKPILSAQALQLPGTTFGEFIAVPSFNSLIGTYSLIGATHITLAAQEPTIDDFFNNAYLTIDDETHQIIDYIGAGQEAITTEEFSVLSSGTYSLAWLTLPNMTGFSVAGATSILGPFSSVGITPSSVVGISFTTTEILPPSYSYFQFTPFNGTGEENILGRQIVGLTITETTAPLPPVAVNITTDDDKQGFLSIILDTPAGRDLKYLEIEYFTDSPLTGTAITNSLHLLDVASVRNELNTFNVITDSEDLSDVPYGNLIHAKVASIDHFGNTSEAAITFLGSTLSSVFQDELSETILDNDSSNIPFTGAGTQSLYSGSIEGGVLTDSLIELNILLRLSSLAGITTSLDLNYNYGGFLAVTHSIPVTGLDNETPIWLNCLLANNGSPTSQILTGSKYSDEVSNPNILTTKFNSTSIDSETDQNLDIELSIIGGTTSQIIREYAIMRQFTDG